MKVTSVAAFLIDGNAGVNFRSWRALIGFAPIHGIWQAHRYNTRFKSVWWSILIALGVSLVASADSWSPLLDVVYECFADADEGRSRPYPVEIGDPTNPPVGVTCWTSRPWNIFPYIGLLLLIVAGFTIRGYLAADPSAPGAMVYNPTDEAGHVTVRFCMKMSCPGVLEVDRAEFDGMTRAQIRDALCERLGRRMEIDIDPFEDDLDYCALLTSRPANLRTKMVQAQRNWWRWCVGMTSSHYLVIFDDGDAYEAEI